MNQFKKIFFCTAVIGCTSSSLFALSPESIFAEMQKKDPRESLTAIERAENHAQQQAAAEAARSCLSPKSQVCFSTVKAPSVPKTPMKPLNTFYLVKGVDFAHVWLTLLRYGGDVTMTPLQAVQYVASLSLEDLSDDDKKRVADALIDVLGAIDKDERAKLKKKEVKVEVSQHLAKEKVYERFLFALHRCGLFYKESPEGMDIETNKVVRFSNKASFSDGYAIHFHEEGSV